MLTCASWNLGASWRAGLLLAANADEPRWKADTLINAENEFTRRPASSTSTTTASSTSSRAQAGTRPPTGRLFPSAR